MSIIPCSSSCGCEDADKGCYQRGREDANMMHLVVVSEWRSFGRVVGLTASRAQTRVSTMYTLSLTTLQK